MHLWQCALHSMALFLYCRLAGEALLSGTAALLLQVLPRAESVIFKCVLPQLVPSFQCSSLCVFCLHKLHQQLQMYVSSAKAWAGGWGLSLCSAAGWLKALFVEEERPHAWSRGR